jgi:hypothetical protein
MLPIKGLTICTAAVALGALPVLAQEIDPATVVRPDDARPSWWRRARPSSRTRR